MKLATYNVWDSDAGMPERENQIIDQINSLDADVIALQEVRNEAFNERLLQGTEYKNFCFAPHAGSVAAEKPWRQNQGLAVYSKHPIKYSKYIDYALVVIVEHLGSSILLVNVHLPSDSILGQEESILSIIKEISPISADYRFLLGDFNCSEASSVHQYLKGYRTLRNTEVNRYWTDLALVAEEHLGIKLEKTLDLGNNPRWKGKSLTDISMRVDCIFIHDVYPNPYPALKALRYFGKETHENTGYSASDHYGVFVDLKMPYENQA